jgi:hypothetical protein
LEKLNDNEDINRAWENIQEDVKNSIKDSLGPYKLKQHKPWFDEECLLLYQYDRQTQQLWDVFM